MLICSSCKNEVEKYAKGKKCRECYNAYMRDYMLRRYHKLRREAITYLGGKCTDCDTTEELEFDHEDARNKSFNIAKIWSYNPIKFWEEVDKCVLRCRPCHIVTTNFQGDVVTRFPIRSGGCGERGVWRCTCDKCKAVRTQHHRDWKQFGAVV